LTKLEMLDKTCAWVFGFIKVDCNRCNPHLAPTTFALLTLFVAFFFLFRRSPFALRVVILLWWIRINGKYNYCTLYPATGKGEGDTGESDVTLMTLLVGVANPHWMRTLG